MVSCVLVVAVLDLVLFLLFMVLVLIVVIIVIDIAVMGQDFIGRLRALASLVAMRANHGLARRASEARRVGFLVPAAEAGVLRQVVGLA